MFAELRKLWADKDAPAIIAHLDEYSDAFRVLHGIVDPSDVYGKDVGRSVRRLVDMRSPSSTYPFLMRLLQEFSQSRITKKDTIESIDAIEAFLARRALCGIEPTGLLGLFRTMWAKVDGHPTARRVTKTILDRLTVEWPNDDRLVEAIRNRPLYGSSIARYAILEYDRAMGLDHPGPLASIEHIMPKSYCDAWGDLVSKSEHGKLKHVWANLVPVSKEMNESVDQLPYEEKRPIFENESMFTSTRRLAKEHDTWGPDKIKDRSDVLGSWAKERWPRPDKQ